MLSKRDLYINHVTQTSTFSMMLDVERAEGMYIYSGDGKRYLDLNSGISVSSLGHRHPKVVKAIKDQVDTHMHTMVYGEHIQSPQTQYADLLTKHLDHGLDNVYLLNSGSEAVEVAVKIAKRYTDKYEIIAAAGAYHGSTVAAESLRSDLDFTSAFRPSIPGIRHIRFNSHEDLKKITCRTACVIMELVQAESGVITPDQKWLKAIRTKCKLTNTLLILDEIQTGFGRTGHLFAHQKYHIQPDILTIGKAMGGGMPISACVAPKEIMHCIADKPTLGHITTFGGHPVCTASALATLQTLLDDKIIEGVLAKEKLIKSLLQHNIIAEVRSSGMMMAVELKRRKFLKHVVNAAQEGGALVDYFLFNDKSFRLAPPLIITEDQIREGCQILLNAMDVAEAKYHK
jgi:acetylornithine/N-succinyldiaminopimelate aminotransferase